MQEKDSELRVVGSNRGGRRRYDEASKRALVEACLHPGVSVARKAQESGVNANLLRKWIAQYLLERERTLARAESPAGLVIEQDANSPMVLEGSADLSQIPAARDSVCDVEPRVPSFVSVVQIPAVPPASNSMALALHVRLPNGVEFDLGKTNLEDLTTIVQTLGRMPCSGSTKS